MQFNIVTFLMHSMRYAINIIIMQLLLTKNAYGAVTDNDEQHMHLQNGQCESFVHSTKTEKYVFII